MPRLNNFALAALSLLLWPGGSLAEDATYDAGEPVETLDNPKADADTAAPESDNSTAPQEEASAQYNTVILQGLNKVTGHVSKLEGPVGTVMRFGNLEIIARRCWKSAPEDSPENSALLDISELKPGEPPQKLFQGWMFSSSPGLSGLQHAVYDITVLGCENRKDPEKADKPKKPEKPEKPKKKAD